MTEAGDKPDALEVAFQRELAKRYLFGEGIRHDDSDAGRWFAKKGDGAAAYEVAEMFIGGQQGIDYSSFEALRWYKIAAGLGHVEALMILGVTFEMGNLGIPVDKVAAHVYYSLAKARGRETIDDLLAGLETSMDSAQLKEARRLFQALGASAGGGSASV